MTIYGDFLALKKHASAKKNEFNASANNRADSIILTPRARDCIECAPRELLGETLLYEVNVKGAEMAFRKFLGLIVERWDADEIEVRHVGR